MSLDVVLRPNVFTKFVKEGDFIDTNVSDSLVGNFADLEHFAFGILQADSILAKLFGVYAIFMVSVFLYGISDRFFIANSSEIEFPILVFFIHLGALLLFFVHTFVDFLLAIETVTLASYALAAFERKNRFSTFAGVQYFILGSIPSGLLILGMALLYKN
jgi:NADH-quinone oxidoreductase subunit N